MADERRMNTAKSRISPISKGFSAKTALPDEHKKKGPRRGGRATTIMIRRILMITVAALAAAMILSGCGGAHYRPVELQLQRAQSDNPRSEFLGVLLEHLALQREYAFARGYFEGVYTYNGAKTSEDGRTVVFLFEAHRLPYLRWAYVVLSFGESAYMVAEENTSAEARARGTTNDGDGEFRGLYKLTVHGARYCSGETKEPPEIEGGEVKLQMYDRMMRRSMLKEMLRTYTPTYCQDDAKGARRPELAGVRFYFSTKEDMEAFASALMGAFPSVRYAGAEQSPAK
jgi:hypothetical protein